MELTYAQISENRVKNLASFAEEPPQDFAGFDAHVFIPEDLPVAIGDTWDGENFYDVDGAVVVSIEPMPDPDPGYDELADLRDAFAILTGGGDE